MATPQTDALENDLLGEYRYCEKSFNEMAQHARELERKCNAYDDLVAALKLTLAGLNRGSVKSQPIIDFTDSAAESVPMVSLSSVIRAALTKAGAI
jgi:hypothetical protein